jgi:hypothetical protein
MSMLLLAAAALGGSRARADDPAPAPAAPLETRVIPLDFLGPPLLDSAWEDLPPYLRPEEGLVPLGADTHLEWGRAGGGSGAVLVFERPPIFESLENDAPRLVEAASDLGVGGAEDERLEEADARLTATLRPEGHARLSALVDAVRGAVDRGIAIDLRLLLVPPDDPLLSPSRAAPPGVVGKDERERLLATAGADGGAKLLFAERRRVRPCEPSRWRRLRSRSFVEALEVNQTGIVPVIAPRVGAVTEGFDAFTVAAPSPLGRGVRVGIRATAASLGEGRRIAALGHDLDLPEAREASVAAWLDVEDGGTRALVLGPPGERTKGALVLLVGAALDPTPPPAPDAGFRLLDLASLAPDPADPGALRGEPEEAVDEVLRRAGDPEPTGRTRIRAAAFLAADAPALARIDSAFVAARAEAPRAHRVDAWLVAFPEKARAAIAAALPPGGAVDPGAAARLLERSARPGADAGDAAPRLLGTLGGGVLEGGLFAVRVRERKRYVSSVDAVSGGVERNVAIVHAPVVRVADHGAALTARLARDGDGLALDARVAFQVVDWSGRAKASLGEGASIEVDLPRAETVEVGGRARLPIGGGCAWFTVAGAKLDGRGEAGELGLLVRVTP